MKHVRNKVTGITQRISDRAFSLLPKGSDLELISDIPDEVKKAFGNKQKAQKVKTEKAPTEAENGDGDGEV